MSLINCHGTRPPRFGCDVRRTGGGTRPVTLAVLRVDKNDRLVSRKTVLTQAPSAYGYASSNGSGGGVRRSVAQIAVSADIAGCVGGRPARSAEYARFTLPNIDVAELRHSGTGGPVIGYEDQGVAAGAPAHAFSAAQRSAIRYADVARVGRTNHRGGSKAASAVMILEVPACGN